MVRQHRIFHSGLPQENYAHDGRSVFTSHPFVFFAIFATTMDSDALPPLPEGFKKEILTTPSIDGEALLRALDEDPIIGVRLNPGKPTGLFADAEPVEGCQHGKILSRRPNFATMPQWHSGAFYVQEPSSMNHGALLTQAIDAVGNQKVRILDFCAAPGGKTTAMAAAMPQGSLLIANEFDTRRAWILNENVLKWGAPGVAVVSSSTERIASYAPCAFDVVAVDAPCSGEGMMRREPEARRQWTSGLVDQCAALQRKILSDACETLRPGGVLIYSTCTFNRKENEENAIWATEELRLKPIGTPRHYMPHLDRGEGLFTAMFRKPADAPMRTRRLKPPRKSKLPDGWLSGEWSGLTASDGSLWAVAPEHVDFVASLASNLNVLAPGIPVAVTKGHSLAPAPELALSQALNNDAFPHVELTLEQALAYLRKEALSLPADTPKGYVTVTYDNLPLGFMKNLGTRANNLYPSQWRLRTKL